MTLPAPLLFVELRVQYKIMKKVNIAAVLMALVIIMYLGYLLAHKTSKHWYPNSGDGPGPVYDKVFAPVNEPSANDPPYWTDASKNDGYLEVYVDWVNEGNGYVYFKYKGAECRVYAGKGLSTAHEGTTQRLKFTSEISTDENFESHRHVTASLAKKPK